MKFVGAHVSAQGGVFNASLFARDIGAGAFALFTKSQKRWRDKPLTPEASALFRENLEAAGITAGHVLPHSGYLINLGNPDPEKRRISLSSLIDEAERARFLGLASINLHPGAHLHGYSEEECLDTIAGCLNEAARAVADVVFVVEGTAGAGTNVGYRFEHLRRVIDGMDDRRRIGVCLDTCHLFAAGYDIGTEEGCLGVMEEFERIVGFSMLRGAHLNDAKAGCGSRADRHESLGRGSIGMEAFGLIMRDSRFDGIPIILETPDPSLWAEEIALLYRLSEG
jgi:deoxyribonuclease-4